jgi:hypothetical protein
MGRYFGLDAHVSSCALGMADARAGLEKARQRYLTGVPWQRCSGTFS